MSLQEITAERLNGYYPFEPSVVDVVSEVAERQAAQPDYRKFLAQVAIGEPFVHHGRASSSPVELLDIRPTRDFDDRSAMVYHLPMATPLDTNMLYQIGTIAAANPETRIIAAGNPGGIGYPIGKLDGAERLTARFGDFKPQLYQVFDYLKRQGIDHVNHVGYSLGAEKAMTAAGSDSHEVGVSVAIEPVAVVRRSRLELGMDFASTAKMLGEYVDANGLEAFKKARRDAIGGKSLGLNYLVGVVGRATNRAIASGLTLPRFHERAISALARQADMTAVISFGAESELARNQETVSIVDDLQRRFTDDRVKSMSLPGQKHALANDLALHSAIVTQGLRT